MTIRIECNTARDLDIAIRISNRVSDSVEFSRKMRRVHIDDASAEDFDTLCDEFASRCVECRMIVDDCESGEALPAGW